MSADASAAAGAATRTSPIAFRRRAHLTAGYAVLPPQNNHTFHFLEKSILCTGNSDVSCSWQTISNIQCLRIQVDVQSQQIKSIQLQRLNWRPANCAWKLIWQLCYCFDRCYQSFLLGILTIVMIVSVIVVKSNAWKIYSANQDNINLVRY